MKIRDSIRRAARSLRQAKGRTILTSLAIAVGAFTLTAALAAGAGAREYADRLIESNVDPQSVFVAKDEQLFGGGGPAGGGLREYSEDATQFGNRTLEALTAEDIATLRAIEGVENVMPMYTVNAQYIEFEGIDTRYTADITAYDPTVRADVAAGELPPIGSQIEKNEIIVPQGYAEVVTSNPSDLIGKKITMRVQKAVIPPSDEQIQEAFLRGGATEVEKLVAQEFRDETFTVRAVTARSSTAFSASTALYISDAAAQELSNYITEGTDQFEKYITATVLVADGTKPESVKAAAEAQGIIARTAQDLQDLLFTIVNILQGIVLVFGVLALIASVFGIINTQYISVLERTREIGLMKALGMRGRHVSRLFQYEAAWIGALGGTVGALLAWAVGTALNPWLSELLTIGENRILIFQPLPIVGLVIALMVLAMVAGWFPARKAAKLDPIDALRTE